jgi:DNA-binding transcriptional ArsR family regulator
VLDMNLIQGKPALGVKFRISLAGELVHIISLVVDADWYEGFDPWVYATHAALPPTLKADMDVVFILIQKSGTLTTWIHRLPPDNPVHRDFAAFVAWANTLDFRELVEDLLRNLSQSCEEVDVALPSLQDTDALRDCLDEKFDGEKLERAVQLVRNPAELKAQFISIVTRFWEQFYRHEYQRCMPLMARSVAYHRRQVYSGDLIAIFAAVAGRRFPRDKDGYEEIERLVFVPSCHIGPYVSFYYDKEFQTVLTMYYNCRPTGAPERDPPPSIQDIFPPLKALSDETRLQILTILNGRELYAQEIVDHLNISQSAVSRHLKLMLAGGLLTVRKEDNMKYFSVNQEGLAALADRLESFQGKLG